jgi:uncharacterized protein with HEPN domain
MKPVAESDRLQLLHMLECIQLVGEYTGLDRDTFFGSRMVQDAALRNLQTMAESSQRLSDELRATEPDIPWKEIAGFGNVLLPGYLGDIGLPGVWEIIVRDLPPLRDALSRMLARVNHGESGGAAPP